VFKKEVLSLKPPNKSFWFSQNGKGSFKNQNPIRIKNYPLILPGKKKIFKANLRKKTFGVIWPKIPQNSSLINPFLMVKK